MPDLEMGYANQEEAIPALSGPAAYQTGTCCYLLWTHWSILCIQVVHAGCEDVNAPVEDLDVYSNTIDAIKTSKILSGDVIARLQSDPCQTLAAIMRHAYHPDPALHSHPLVKLHSLPARQSCFDARYTLQATNSTAYMTQCMGFLKPRVQCECLLVADDLVTLYRWAVEWAGGWQDEWGAQQPPGSALPQPECHGCPPASAAGK